MICLPNLSNALMLKLILYGDERFSVDSNSEILKATKDTYTQHNVLNKMMLLKLSCCNLFGDLYVLFGLLFFLPFKFACSFYLYVKWPQSRRSIVLLAVSFLVV